MSLLKRYAPWIKILVALALFAFVVRRHGVNTFYLSALVQTPFFWVLAILGNLLLTILTAWRWRLLLVRFCQTDLPLPRLLLYSWVSQFLGLVFLGTFGTDFARIFYLQTRAGVPVAAGTKSIVLDRVASTIGLALITISALLFFYQTPLVLSVGASVALLALSSLRLEIFLSVVAHLSKLAVVGVLLLLSGESLSGLTSLLPNLSLGLAAEAMPVSWQGFGVGHLAFATLIQNSGSDLYNSYFLGKLAFKLLGGVFFLHLSFAAFLAYWRKSPRP